MATIPPGQMTRGQIVDQALRKAGNTKASVRTDAIAALNDDILYNLYTQFDWPFLSVEVSFSLVGDSFPLPADYLKSTDDTALLITAVNSSTIRARVHEVTREQLVVLVPTSGVPRLWHPDRALGIGLLWPQPTSQAVQALFRYKRLPPALTSDADIPVFPWHGYLRRAVYVWTLNYEMDPRTQQERLQLEAALKRITEIALPLRASAPVIPLDPQVFGPVFDDDLGRETW